MSAVSREAARLVWEHSGGVCAYCGRALARRDMTVDHWVPQYRGGGDEHSNLRAACEPCNAAKGNMAPDEWEGVAARRRAALARPVVARLSKVELLMRCAPRWAGREKPHCEMQT
jgi:5-methylcytosine-specific restriction endonuclease McrA